MFTTCQPPQAQLPVLLPVPVVNALLPLPSKRRPTQLHLLEGGGLVLVHRAGPGRDAPDLPRLLDAWGFADVSVNLMVPLEGIPLVLLAAQAGELPPVMADIQLSKIPRAKIEQWLQEAVAAKPATLQIVLLEPVADSAAKGRVRLSRALAISDSGFWRPLCRVLREQLTMLDQGDTAVLSVAADAMLTRPGAAAGVLAGGPVAQYLS